MDSAAEDDYSDLQDVDDVCHVTLLFSTYLCITTYFVFIIDFKKISLDVLSKIKKNFRI